MIRLLLVVAALAAVLAAAWSTGLSSAAFVDTAETTAGVQADHVDQWLTVADGPEDGPCREAGDGFECSVAVEARSPLPGGAASIDVRLTTAASGAAGRAAAPAAEATLAAGERRTLTIMLPEREHLRVSARTPGDSTDFLSRTIAACGPQPCDDDGPGGGTNPGGDSKPPVDPTRLPGEPSNNPPAGGGTPAPLPNGTATTTAERSQDGPAASVAQGTPAASVTRIRRCVSRRRFTVRLPRAHRGKRVLAARVTVGKRRIATRRRSGRLTAVVDLRGLRRTQVRVVALLRLAGGRTVRHVRIYRTCSRRAATDAGS